jgi:hypothetical protein
MELFSPDTLVDMLALTAGVFRSRSEAARPKAALARDAGHARDLLTVPPQS